METDSQEALLRKSIRSNRIKIVADIILIIVILGIGWYVYSEIDNFKLLGSDVCRLCEEKTGGKCMKGYGVTQTCPPCKDRTLQFNLSSLQN